MTQKNNDWVAAKVVNRVYLQDESGSFTLTNENIPDVSDYRLNDIDSHLDKMNQSD